jgi:mono/diheme cytochrome c family protein
MTDATSATAVPQARGSTRLLSILVLLFANEPDSGGTSGGTGPQLSDGKVRAAFPTVDDQIKVVTNERNGMPAFGSNLSAADISLVVDYTRTL